MIRGGYAFPALLPAVTNRLLALTNDLLFRSQELLTTYLQQEKHFSPAALSVKNSVNI